MTDMAPDRSTLPRRPARPALATAQRVVVKLGTRVLTDDRGHLAEDRLDDAVQAVCEAWQAGREVLVVSSGAVGLGSQALGLEAPPVELAERQACAAVGQVRLMGLWQEHFARRGRTCAQLLLTQDDFDLRGRYLDLRAALVALLAHGSVPVINENDVVRTDELRFVDTGSEGRPVFGDNDGLSAQVATKLGADLLVLLTDVPGVYARDPRVDPDAPLLAELSADDRQDQDVHAGGARSAASRGGMASKVGAARVAARSGCHAVIADGRQPGTLSAVLAGQAVGTWCRAWTSMSARQRWIAFAAAPRGVLHLDSGAVDALCHGGASLLAIGVTAIEGAFERGDVVLLRDPVGRLIGRGAVHCDAEAAHHWVRGRAPDGARSHHALVHRDHLVLEPVP